MSDQSVVVDGIKGSHIVFLHQNMYLASLSLTSLTNSKFIELCDVIYNPLLLPVTGVL